MTSKTKKAVYGTRCSACGKLNTMTLTNPWVENGDSFSISCTGWDCGVETMADRLFEGDEGYAEAMEQAA